MSEWQPMDLREWSDSSPPVIVAINRAADPGEKIYVVGEAKYFGEKEGWLLAGEWVSYVHPDFWQPLPEPPQSILKKNHG